VTTQLQLVVVVVVVVVAVIIIIIISYKYQSLNTSRRVHRHWVFENSATQNIWT
jgi:hypothetical protein